MRALPPEWRIDGRARTAGDARSSERTDAPPVAPAGIEPGAGLSGTARPFQGTRWNTVLQLTCPYCGAEADETELASGGQAHITRHGPGSSDEDFEDYLFLRGNPDGVHFERWRHAFGCGKWFHAARCTRTHEVFGTYPAQTLVPPGWIEERIKAKRPDWQGVQG